MPVEAIRFVKKGHEWASIAHESATRGLEILAETVRVFAGPFIVTV